MRFTCGPESPREKDSLWSNVVCLCASLSQVLVMGICQGFGVFLPAIMDDFHTSREFTGESVCKIISYTSAFNEF